jgi:hypothetical protein
MKVVWIISTSDPIRIQIMQVRRRVFKIHANVDNPNPIVCGCGLDMMLVISDGSGLSDNWMLIIRGLIGYSTIMTAQYGSYTMIFYLYIIFLAHKILAIYSVCTCIENLNRSHV